MRPFYESYREQDDRIFYLSYENDSCDAHFHSNIEILYVVKGEISITINGQNMTLTEGGVSIASSYDIHSYKTTKYSKTIVIIIPVEIVGSFMKMMRAKSFASPFMESRKQSKEIHYALNKLSKIGSFYEPHIEKGYAYVVLGILSKCIGMTEKPVSSSVDLARKILLYLQQNYTENVTIEGLSKLFGYNKDYLSRFFNSYLSCGFNSYLNGLRARHAAVLLTENDMELSDIAFKSGFSNYRTFNRAFKEVYNTTPSEFIKHKLMI